MTTTKTLTYKSSELYNHSQTATSSSPLPQIPANFPLSKLIPKTRFIIDGFRNAGEFSLSYFLSHFHSDHYSGLSPSWSRGVIYCSSITARLVVETLGVSKRLVVELPLNEAVLIDDCEVTLIDANHCPGAVQFLFKVPVNGEFERFVHTGDFRFCHDMKFVPVLNDFVGCDGVFLDTTYCDPKFVFPKQEESIDYVVSVIKKVKSESESKSVLFLVATYVIGKEKILVEIARRCGCRIYVDGRKMGVLRALGYENEGVFTEDELGSDVHVVGWNVLGETWPYFRPNFVKMKEIMVEKGYSKVVGFVPTGWTYEVKRNKFAVRVKDSFEIHLVPYSEHSNYNELREYVKFLKPKRVIPTVGSDVENVDSKHAAKMRKHFAGLVDEMANKQDFLMGFYRVPQEKGKVKRDDLVIDLDNEVEQLEESDPCDMKQDHNPGSGSGSICSPTLKDEPGSEDIASLSHKEKDEIMQELEDCLPTWVSENILLELVKSYGKNIVDAVSHFYEHETEFHERSGKPLPSSQSNPKSDDTSSLNPTHGESSLQIQVKPPNQGLKFPPSKQSVVKSVSPAKRKKISDNKPNKKGKVNSNLEAGGIKQCTITKFFSKSSSVGQGSITTPLSDVSTYGKSSSGLSSINHFEEEIKQFIQIIDGNESMKGYSAEMIEKAGGNVDLALDMHYRNSEAQINSHQKSLDLSSKPVTYEGFDASTSILGKDRSGASDKVYKSAQDSVAENISATYVSLPPEKYSPVEHACWKQGQPAPYIHLARTFDLVECEKGKIKATSMLSNMFRSLLALSPDDVLPAVYLCTNKIAADHENMELNIGGSLVASAIEEACGTNRTKIREMYNNLGDLGDVAQECRQTQSLLLPPPPLLIRDVYSVLRKIRQAVEAQVGGKA